MAWNREQQKVGQQQEGMADDRANPPAPGELLQGQGQGTAATGGPKESALRFKDNAPSWEELEQAVKQKQAALGVEPQSLESGPADPRALRRTFGQSGEPRIKLYRDHATWCPYCHKVILQLEEKQIPYIVEKINMRCYGDKPAEFMRKVPRGLLPVMEVDGGKPITESAVIMQLLEELYPETPLLPPPGTPERQRADSLMRLERRLFSDWLQWLCQAWGHESNRAVFIETMDVVEQQLGAAGGPFFLGRELSLVDITFAPFLERIAASIAYYKGFIVRGQGHWPNLERWFAAMKAPSLRNRNLLDSHLLRNLGRWPNLERWFAAMEARPAYLGFKSDYYTHCHDLPPQLGGCAMSPEGEPVAAAIDGQDGKSWHLPLPPLTATSLEPHAPGESPEGDRLEAAARLVGNHAAVTRFALRGVGQPGPRPVSAPLADPSAVPGMEWEQEVDAALRHVAHALLDSVEAKQASQHAMHAVPAELDNAPGTLDGSPVIPSLEYVRDRVGVPRDMQLPAARQFRAHLNWAIDSLRP
ncbi:hypothetical protein N2152v2_010339 [Parachlorella kessleri]